MRPASLIATLSLVAACTNPGQEPPPGRIYFPTAITIAGQHLVVANANFDVRYSAGSLQSFDLDLIDDAVAECIANPNVDGSPCVRADTGALLVDEVLIDSFASAIAFAPGNETHNDRLYVTTRSNGGLTYVDMLPSGELDCGQASERRCSANRVVGLDPSTAGVTMTAQPTAVTAGNVADLVGADTATRTERYALVGDFEGGINLFIDDGTPELRFVRRGLRGEVTSIAANQGTIVTSHGDTSLDSKRINQLGVLYDPANDFYATYLASPLTFSRFGSSANVRAVAFTSETDRRMVAVTLQPFALLTTDLDHRRETSTSLLAESVVALGTGPSKVMVGKVGNDARTFAFVSCFDAREIAVVDLGLQRLVSVIQGVTGPFSLALDSARERLYVGDFRSSTIRVVDLSPLVAPRISTEPNVEPPSPRVVVIIGQPSEPQVLQ